MKKFIIFILFLLTMAVIVIYFQYNSISDLRQNYQSVISQNDSIKNSNGVLYKKISDLDEELILAKKAKIKIKRIKSVTKTGLEIRYDTIIELGETIIIKDSIYGKSVKYIDKCFNVSSTFSEKQYSLNIVGVDTVWGYRYSGEKIGKWKFINLIKSRKRLDTYSIYNTNPCIKITFSGFIDGEK